MRTVNMKHNIRAVAIDLDGTTLHRDKSIGQRTIDAVNRALDLGVEVMISTGRSRVQFERYLEHFPKIKYAISSSGAAVYDVRTWDKLISNEMPAEVVQEVLEYAKTQDCFPILSVEGRTVYPAAMAPLAAAYGLGEYTYEIENFGTGVENIYTWHAENRFPVESVSLYFHDHTPCKPAVEALSHLPLYIALPGEPGVEMSMKNANKGAALTALCERAGISLKELMVIGDSDNDVPMMAIAGLSVASGNASDAVKQKADVVTLDCDEDGVGAAIEQYVLNPQEEDIDE